MLDIIKRLVSILLVCLMVTLHSNPVKSEEQTRYTEYDKLGFTEVVDSHEVMINGKRNKLLRTFADQKEAISKFVKDHYSFIEGLRREYKLNELSEYNYQDYISSYYRLLDEKEYPEWYSSLEGEYFEVFVDILENKQINNTILWILENSDMNKIENQLQVAYLLPQDNPLIEQLKDLGLLSVSVTYDREASNIYAAQYCISPNTTDYYYYTFGDCTNFASQILEAGGAAQNNTGSQYSGWWHLTDGTNTSSNSWRLANAFCAYYGMYYTTSSNNAFSHYLQKGSFISFDKGNDGSWDHVAYVTAVRPYTSSLGYCDYRVAQHTTNYLAWASSSTNGWEELENSTSYTYIYGIVIH